MADVGKGGKSGKGGKPDDDADGKGGKAKGAGKGGGKDEDDTDAMCAKFGGVKVTLNQDIGGDNVERYFLLAVPPADADKAPVLFGFHGFGGRPEMYLGMFSSYVKDGEFVGVYPCGHARSWNVGEEPSNADDVGFVDLIIKELRTPGKYPQLNMDKLFAYGNSNGGGMVQKLGYETAHFHAVCSSVTTLPVGKRPDPKLPPLSVMQVMAMKDELIPYAGGHSCVGTTFEPAEEGAKIWAEHCGCKADDVLRTVTAKGNVRLEWTNSCTGKRVLHIGLAEEGHDWKHATFTDAELGIDRDIYSKIWRFLFDAP